MMDEKILSSIVSDILVQNLKSVRVKGLEEVQSLREEFNSAMAKAAIGSSASVTSALEVLSEKVSKALSLQEENINKLVSKAESLTEEIEALSKKGASTDGGLEEIRFKLSEALTANQNAVEYLKSLLSNQIEDLRKSIPSLKELEEKVAVLVSENEAGCEILDGINTRIGESKGYLSDLIETECAAVKKSLEGKIEELRKAIPEPDGRVDVVEGAIQVLQEKMVRASIIEKTISDLTEEIGQVRKEIPVIPLPDPRVEELKKAETLIWEHLGELEEKVGPLFHESVETKAKGGLLDDLSSKVSHIQELFDREIKAFLTYAESLPSLLQEKVEKVAKEADATVTYKIEECLGKVEAALAEVEKEFSSLRDSDNLDHNQRLGRLERLTKDASEVADKIAERITGLESKDQEGLLDDLSSKVSHIQELFDREIKAFLTYAESLPSLLQEKVEKVAKEADEAATYKIEECLGTVYKRIEAVEEEGEGRVKTAENFFGSELATLRSDVEAEFAEALKINREISEARMKELDDALSANLQAQNAVAAKEFSERLASTREDLSLRIGEAKDYFSNRVETLFNTFVLQKESVAAQTIPPAPVVSEITLELPEPETWYQKTWPSKSCVTCKGGTWFARRTTEEEPSSSCPDWVLVMNGVAKMDISLPSYSTLRVNTTYSNGTNISEDVPLHLNRHKGKWNETSEYSFNDEVAWDNGTWRWTKWETPSKGVRPPAEGWTLAAKGEKGRSQKGDTGVGISSISREADQLVIVLTDASVKRFELPERIVEVPKQEECLGIRMNFLGSFQEGAAYPIGSVVRFSGSLYLAIADTASRPEAKSNSWELLV